MSQSDPVLFDVPEEMWARRRCPVCGCALTRLHPHLYVVKRQGWVKIGATNNLQRRINELARPAWTKHILSPEGMDWKEPLTIQTIVINGGDLEHEAHQRFQKLHVRGEWFWDFPQIREWLEEVVRHD